MRLTSDAELRNLVNAVKQLAAGIETLQRDLSDRMDLIEGRLDELNKKQNPEGRGEIVAGKKPWTVRRDERARTHFNREQLLSRIANGS